ncbi:MAG TPA: xanthine dehydrogenase family protein molybdopterin-binding subunit [Burkholderiales bacterium]
MKWIGRSLRRVEDPALLVGRGRFTADAARGAAAVRFVRSAVARGRIKSISRPEGALVFTAEDLEGVKPIRPLLHRPDYVPIEHPVLARGRVNHVGEAFAVVVAEDAATAEDIAESVEADIETEEAVVDIDGALHSSALVHEMAKSNVIVEGAMRTPGVEAAFGRAAQVVEIDIRSRRQSAMPMEPRGGHAAWDEASGRVTLTCSVQMPHMLRTGLADSLGIAEADLRVIAPDVGGGFGQKMQLFPEYVVLVWLARRLRRSLAWIEDRHENFLASAHARDQHHLLRAAFDQDARLLAIDADIRCNVGAYSCYPTTCGVEPLMALAELPGPYDFREYAVRARGVATNTCMMAPYRGVSRPVLTFTMERLMDTAAARFGLDPVEIRRRNLIRKFPYTSASGVVYDEGSYLKTLEAAAAAVDVPAFKEKQKTERAKGRYLGLGFSAFSERSGYGSKAFAARKMDIVPGYETVEIAMDPSGYVVARIGASPHGQGLRTSLAQIIADGLGLAPDKIRIVHGDTDNTPYGWGTFASRSLVISGGACKLAAEALARRITTIAAGLLEAAALDIELAEGKARVKGTDKTIEIARIARAAYQQSHLVDGGPGLRESATYDPDGTFSNACHAAIVEVDIQTGGVVIRRFVVAEDAGILVNPMIVDGQVHGGVAQGIANALYEEIKYDEQGNLLTTSLADYLPPTCAEVPEIEIHHLVTLSDATITKAKGVGEGGTIGAPAAVVNAIVDALSPFGVDFFEMPVTPQRIRQKLREVNA